MQTYRKSEERISDILFPNLERVGLTITDYSQSLLLAEDSEKNFIYLKVRAGEGEHFKIKKSDLRLPRIVLVYIWNIDFDPECFFMTPSEALDLLGPAPLQTRSWMFKGYYNWSSASGLPALRRKLFICHFSNRWRWLADYAQKVSKLEAPSVENFTVGDLVNCKPAK
jgi:hypothetical protein